MKSSIVLLVALSPMLVSAAEPETYECVYLEGPAGAVTVTVEPKDTDVHCTIDVGTVSPGPHTVKVSAKTPVVGGSAQVTFLFGVAQPKSP